MMRAIHRGGQGRLDDRPPAPFLGTLTALAPPVLRFVVTPDPHLLMEPDDDPFGDDLEEGYDDEDLDGFEDLDGEVSGDGFGDLDVFDDDDDVEDESF